MTIQLTPPNLLAVLMKIMPGPIRIEERTCILDGLSLKGETLPFERFGPSSQHNFK